MPERAHINPASLSEEERQRWLDALLGNRLPSPPGGDLGIGVQNLLATPASDAKSIAEPLFAAVSPKNAASQLVNQNPLGGIASKALDFATSPNIATSIGQSDAVRGAVERLRGVGLDDIMSGLGGMLPNAVTGESKALNSVREFATENPDILGALKGVGLAAIPPIARKALLDRDDLLRLLDQDKDPYRSRTPQQSAKILEASGHPSGRGLISARAEAQVAAQAIAKREGLGPGRLANLPTGGQGRATVTAEGIPEVGPDPSQVIPNRDKAYADPSLDPSKSTPIETFRTGMEGSWSDAQRPTSAGPIDDIGRDIAARETRAAPYNVDAFNSGRADFREFDPGLRGTGTGASSAREAFFLSRGIRTSSGYYNFGPIRADVREAITKEKDKYTAQIKELEEDSEYLEASRVTKQMQDDYQKVRTKEMESGGPVSWKKLGFAHEMVDGLDQKMMDTLGPEASVKFLKHQRYAEAHRKKMRVVEQRGKVSKYDGRNTIPARLRMENPLVYDFHGDSYRDANYTFLIQEAKKSGFDSVIFRNTKDGGPLDDVFAVWDSENIRSRYAKFENLPPSRTTRDNLGGIKTEDRKAARAEAYKQSADEAHMKAEQGDIFASPEAVEFKNWTEEFAYLRDQAEELALAGDSGGMMGAQQMTAKAKRDFADWLDTNPTFRAALNPDDITQIDHNRVAKMSQISPEEIMDLELHSEAMMGSYGRELNNNQLANRIAELRTIPLGGYKTHAPRPLTSVEKAELEVLLPLRDKRIGSGYLEKNKMGKQAERNLKLDAEADTGRRFREAKKELVEPEELLMPGFGLATTKAKWKLYQIMEKTAQDPDFVKSNAKFAVDGHLAKMENIRADLVAETTSKTWEEVTEGFAKAKSGTPILTGIDPNSQVGKDIKELFIMQRDGLGLEEFAYVALQGKIMQATGNIYSIDELFMKAGFRPVLDNSEAATRALKLKNLLKIQRDQVTDPAQDLRDLLGYDISEIDAYPLSLDENRRGEAA